MKTKGFTLVELLVAIAILGIITAIAIPGVRKLQSQNAKKKYEEYAKSLEYAAKIYIEDVGFKPEVTYSDLVGRNLIKDFDQNGITCNNTYTKVTIQKVGDPNNSLKQKYKYTVKLRCTKNNIVQYQS